MVDCGRDECQKKKKNSPDRRLFLVHLVRIAAPRRKAEALVGNKTYTYYVKSCAFEKECKENYFSRMGGGLLSLCRPFGPHFGLRAPPLDPPLL